MKHCADVLLLETDCDGLFTLNYFAEFCCVITELTHLGSDSALHVFQSFSLQISRKKV
jgi:hypothetical protein